MHGLSQSLYWGIAPAFRAIVVFAIVSYFPYVFARLLPLLSFPIPQAIKMCIALSSRD
jgi:hypothetical protein